MRQFGDCSYMYLRASNVYLLAITKGNTNAMMAFQFLTKVHTHICSPPFAPCTIECGLPARAAAPRHHGLPVPDQGGPGWALR